MVKMQQLHRAQGIEQCDLAEFAIMHHSFLGMAAVLSPKLNLCPDALEEGTILGVFPPTKVCDYALSNAAYGAGR